MTQPSQSSASHPSSALKTNADTGRVYFFDTTLRDGEQSPGVALNHTQKVEIGQQLAALGVDIIEAGFPIASAGDLAGVQRIAREVRGPTIAALARAGRADIEAAARGVEAAEKARIHTFIATSPIHMQKKLRLEPEQVVERAVEAVRLARSLVDDVEFSAEDATRSDPEFLLQIFGAVVEAGATTINVPDTVGYTTPRELQALFTRLRAELPTHITLSAHCHDDLGLAVANSIAAAEGGARQIECTVNGIGERAGNAALEEIVMAFATRADVYGLHTGVNTREIYRASRLVSRLSGMPVQPNKAVVGDNAFAHESGIHQDGILKARDTYEIMNAETVGREAAVMVMGKHSGRAAFRDALTKLGYTHLGEEKVQHLFERFKDLADRKGQLHAEDLRALVEARADVPQTFKLLGLRFTSGIGEVVENAETIELLQKRSSGRSESPLSQARKAAKQSKASRSEPTWNDGATFAEVLMKEETMMPMATVRIETANGPVQATAYGDGPVDAVFQALADATGYAPELEMYRIQSVTRGDDALGEVSITVRYGGGLITSVGVAADVVEASARAYLRAINMAAAGMQAKRRQEEFAP